ncbi:hypothetical protein MQE23_08320 [Streptomyces sp. HP-A2021]|uniref:hypothetical protein n=1 Tax=Streptomyces sp. HP-A2021 TaxID=2927875 RepID=UPI001FAFC0E8|nr:hypothetical protein [Streptomyces sp. HP-A2021]UOB09055.1 hypothetical protein MQE23_08320 [Streptomyces sp. HP-A2021]
MNPADAVWGGLILAGAAFEVYALRNARVGDTLSESTRRWFRVHTKAGAVAFAVGWTGFAVWYLAHILD